MLELAPGGFEEVSGDGWVELVVHVEDDSRVREVFGDVSSAVVPGGWEDAWRAFHRPVRAGGLWIGPPWERPPAGEPTVIVDPGRAFGTGAHPTTRACIELLSRQQRCSVFDAGCGSGVLAVAAARLGFGPVHALDVDPAAVAAARATAQQNDVDVDVRLADVLADELPRADLLVANIELGAVERLLARRPAARAVVAGYLAHERPRAPGWTAGDRLELDGWAADVLKAGTRHASRASHRH